MDGFLILLVIGFLIAVFLTLLKPAKEIISTFVKLFTFVYDTVKPSKSSTKFIAALVSIAYGVFAILIMGGPIGALMPFFLNPVGFIVALFVLIVGYLFTIICLFFVVARLETGRWPTLRASALRPVSKRVQCYWNLEKSNATDQDLENLVKNNPNDPDTYYAVGMHLSYKYLSKRIWARDRTKDAIPYFYKCIELNPKDSSARYELGLALDRAGEYAEAEVQLKEACDLRPQNTDIRHTFGRILESHGKVEEAITQYRRIFPSFDYSRNRIEAVNRELRLLDKLTGNVIERKTVQPPHP